MLPRGINAKLTTLSNNRCFEIAPCAKCWHFPQGVQQISDARTFLNSCSYDAELRFQFPVFAMPNKVVRPPIIKDSCVWPRVQVTETSPGQQQLTETRTNKFWQECFPKLLHCWCEILNLGCWHPWTKQNWVTTPNIENFASAMCYLEGSTQN